MLTNKDGQTKTEKVNYITKLKKFLNIRRRHLRGWGVSNYFLDEIPALCKFNSVADPFHFDTAP